MIEYRLLMLEARNELKGDTYKYLIGSDGRKIYEGGDTLGTFEKEFAKLIARRANAVRAAFAAGAFTVDTVSDEKVQP